MARPRVLPKGSIRVSYFVPKPHKDFLDGYCKRKGLAISDVLRQAVARYVQELEMEEKYPAGLGIPKPTQPDHTGVIEKYVENLAGKADAEVRSLLEGSGLLKLPANASSEWIEVNMELKKILRIRWMAYVEYVREQFQILEDSARRLDSIKSDPTGKQLYESLFGKGESAGNG